MIFIISDQIYQVRNTIVDNAYVTIATTVALRDFERAREPCSSGLGSQAQGRAQSQGQCWGAHPASPRDIQGDCARLRWLHCQGLSAFLSSSSSSVFTHNDDDKATTGDEKEEKGELPDPLSPSYIPPWSLPPLCRSSSWRPHSTCAARGDRREQPYMCVSQWCLIMKFECGCMCLGCVPLYTTAYNMAHFWPQPHGLARVYGQRVDLFELTCTRLYHVALHLPCARSI